MANESAVADAGTAAGAAKGADAGATGGEGKSILDGAQAPGKVGETNGKAADAAAKSADGKVDAQAGKTQEEGKTGAPEKYEPFKTPEGIKLDDKAVEQFTALAKTMNLSQDASQKLVDFQTSQIKAAQEQNLKDFSDMQKQWATETRKALGNDADKQLGFAAAARDKFLNTEVTMNGEKTTAAKVLNASGLANHPAVIQSLIAIGKAISEDTFVEGGKGKGGGDEKTIAQKIYPNQK